MLVHLMTCLVISLSPSAVLQTRSVTRVPASANGAPLRFQCHGQRRITCCDGSDDYYGLRFDGVHRLFGGAQSRARLESARIVVVGLGGVGSWTVEALARSGVGSLVLIDLDEICISNTNRQLHALHDTVGRSKAKMLEARVLSINPECTVQVREEWVMPSNAHEILQEEAAAAAARGETLALVDAVDGFQEKASMVVAAFELGLHVVLVGAAGGKIDPTAVRVADLTEVTNDKLLRRVRQQLRKEHGFPAGDTAARSSRRAVARRWGVPCVYSVEASETTAQGEGPQCDRFGTACFATGAFGFAAAAHIATAIAKGLPPPKRPRVTPRASAAPQMSMVSAPSRTPVGGIVAADHVETAPLAPTADDAVLGGTAALNGGGGARGGDGVGAGAGVAPETPCEECEPCEQSAAAAAAIAALRFDSHCHALSDASALLAGAAQGGVCMVSTCEPDWVAAAAAGDECGGCRYALGVHPWFVHLQADGWEARLRDALVRHPSAAVGEVGLDRFRLDAPFESQVGAFTAQLALAAELRRPLIVHCVRADGVLLDRCAPSPPPPHRAAGCRRSW